MGKKNRKSDKKGESAQKAPAPQVEVNGSAAPEPVKLSNGSVTEVAPSRETGATAQSTEAEQIKFMISKMAKQVEVGSEWFIVSMKWINKWQKSVGFEDDQAPSGVSPGKIDNSDIIDIHPESSIGSSTLLPEMSQLRTWQNFQLKKAMCEGTDFMLVDKNIYSFWQAKYGKEANEIKRLGIVDESGEKKVEIYLKQVNIYAMPNAFFKMDKVDSKKAKHQTYHNPVYISRADTVDDLKKKILRCLNAHVYFVIKEKSIMIKDVKLWKSNYEDKGDPTKILRALDKKLQTYTSVDIKANLINSGPEDLHKKLHEVDLADTDMLIVEAPEKGEFVFKVEGQDNDTESDGSEEEKNGNSQVKKVAISGRSLKHINELNIQDVFKKSSRQGRVGLQNMGNTCFMNSGLQCLSNTHELTKFFLFDLYKADINTDSPLGLNGNLAKAYHSLMYDMWIGKESRTAPYDLKRVLGKKLQQFSGYGQQCAGELLTCLLDYLHEDLNRIKKKPYIEIPDQEDRTDQEMSDLSWKAFLARNQSIIVDLMYGQLKSTVKCNECGKISITYDPYLTLPLPISKPNYFKTALVQYDLFREKAASPSGQDSSSEEDPDFKDERQVCQNEQFMFNFTVNAQTTVLDVKKQMIEKVSKIGGRTIYPQNLTLAKCKYGEIYEEWTDKDLVDNIDTSNMGKTYAQEQHIFIEVRPDLVEASGDRACTELNFAKCSVGSRGNITSQVLGKALPRYQDFMKSDTIFEIKQKLYQRLKNCYSKKQQEDANEEWINNALIIMIKDNTPIQKGQYGNKKVVCEFCGEIHNQRNDTCDLKTELGSGNDLEFSKKLRLQDLYDMLIHKREIIFEVQLNIDEGAPDIQGLQHNFVDGESGKALSGGVQQLDSLFSSFTTEELLSGNDQYYCSRCQEHRDANKTLSLFKTPKVMIIHLKRFKSKKQAANSGKSGFFNLAYAQICQQEKIDEPVEFPIEGLDIKEHLQMDCAANGISTVYDLYAIVNHFGNLNGGHYTAFAKNPDGNWYDFNDSQVSGANLNNLCSSAAYLLFYRRREDSVPNPESSDQGKSTLAQTSDSRNSEKSDNSAAYIDELD